MALPWADARTREERGLMAAAVGSQFSTPGTTAARMICSTNRVQAIAAAMAPMVFLTSAPSATPIIPGLVQRGDRRTADLSPATAKTHVGRLLTKLQARERDQLVVIAYETGLVTPSRP